MSTEQATGAAEAPKASEQDEKAGIWAELEKAEAGQGRDGATDDGTDISERLAKDASDLTPEPGAALAPKDGKQQDDQADIWTGAQLTPAQQTYLDGLNKKLRDLEHDKSSNAGRVSVLQRQIDEFKFGKKAPPAPEQPTKTAEQIQQEKDARDRKIAEARETFPEVVEVLEEQSKETQAELDALKQQVTGLTQQSATIEEERTRAHITKQVGIVLTQHPDYPALRKTPEFAKWKENASQMSKDAIARNAKAVMNAQEVSEVVALFKLQTGWKAPETAAPEGGGTGKQGLTEAERRELQAESSTGPRSRQNNLPPSGLPGGEDRQAIWDGLEKLGL